MRFLRYDDFLNESDAIEKDEGFDGVLPIEKRIDVKFEKIYRVYFKMKC